MNEFINFKLIFISLSLYFVRKTQHKIDKNDKRKHILKTDKPYNNNKNELKKKRNRNEKKKCHRRQIIA